MKLTILLFLFTGLSVFAGKTYSQTKKLNLEMRNSTVKEVLQRIEEQSEFYFMYSEKLVDVKRQVSVEFKNQRINDVLDGLFAGTDVEYKIRDRFILLTTPEVTGSNLLALEQGTIITGTVTDANGNPLPGVNIVEVGTTNGAVTDLDGNYTITVSSEDAVLSFSFVGYLKEQIEVGGQTSIDVTLVEDIQALDEVVVVGYGTQQKANLTGSVSSANIEELEKRSVTNVSQALAGATSGLTVTQGSGQPGEDQAAIRIRGLGTFSGAGKSPLVLIDGIAGNINDVNPNDIAEVSVLKDAASASIYGSRAANGVILIETKEGEAGKLQVRYESYMGIQEAVELPEYVDSWTYAEMLNEARGNVGLGKQYSSEEIDKFRSGEDPDEYPNEHHAKDFFNSGNGFQTKHDLTFSGGTEETQFLFSTGYLKQNGLIEQVGYDRYNMRLNVNSQIHEKLRLNAIIAGKSSIKNEPASAEANLETITSFANRFPSTVPAKKSDGSYGVYGGHYSARAHLDGDGFLERKDYTVQSNVSLEWDILSSLKLTGKMGYNKGFSKSRDFGAEFYVTPTSTEGPSTLDMSTSNSDYLDLQLFADYDKTFGDHNIHVLGGMSRQQDNYEWMGAYRENFPNTKLSVLDAGGVENSRNSGSARTWKLESYFGRLNYSFMDRYLLEGNLRYDGSSRFAEGNRFGLFPSMSAGWILSEEDFFQVPWVEQLKIRGSYGVLGNQDISTYPYQRTLSLGHSTPLGVDPSIHPGVQLTTLPFEDISWETTNVTNVGVDIGLFGGKINLVAEYYNKKTYDILYNLTVADVIGKNVSEQNAGEVENKGWDFELTYRNTMGDFSYRISPNFSINHNKVLNLGDVERDIEQGLFVGEPLSAIYGYETEGLFVDEEDVANYAEQGIYDARPGMIRYKDISGPEGEPDGEAEPEHDRRVIGNEFPTYTYGMGVSADYKGFDFYLQMQGLGGFDRLIGQGQAALYNNYNIQKWHVENRWTEENPDRNAEHPVFQPLGMEVPWGTMNSQYWMRDASFLRIKDIQLGYSLPSTILDNSFMDQCRLYISGSNIYTFDNYYPGYDPEMDVSGFDAGNYYPATSLWKVGINVQF